MDLNAETLRRLGSDNQAVAYAIYEELSRMSMDSTAPAKSAERKKLAAFLAGELNATDPGGKDEKGKDKPPVSRYSMRVRNQVARLLGIVAGAAEVPALAAAIKELDLRESARCALDRVGGDAATDALIAALDEVDPTFRVGVVGSLGGRGGEKVVKALQALADDVDAEVRLAAVDALAKIPDASSNAMMVKLAQGPCPCGRQTAIKARIRLAETLAKSGNKAAARGIYHDVSRGDAEPPQKKAAEIGLKTVG